MLDVLLRPVARVLLPRVQSELDQVPRPTDAPQFHVAGPDPDRVLVFGNGPAIGFGVRSQELALPGRLGRRVAQLTGRGIDVDVTARRGTSVEAASALLEALRPNRYDGIVVFLGVTDAAVLLPARRWRAAMAEFLERLLALTSEGASIMVVGIHSIQRSATTSGLLGDTVDGHARRLNAITRVLCDDDDRLRYVERDGSAPAALREAPADGFARLAELIGPPLAAGLDSMARAGSGRAARVVRDTAQPERERQSALHRLAIVDTVPEYRFDRIVRSARASFGAAHAMITLVDGRRQWAKAVSSSLPEDSLPAEIPREMSICARTIRRDRALVIGDLSEDPETHPAVLAAGFRFYAGFPIESPDGYRVGSLCLLDTVPRDADSVDIETLRDLAMLVQHELWPQEAQCSPVRQDGRGAAQLPVVTAVHP